jgi:hypothetical protein
MYYDVIKNDSTKKNFTNWLFRKPPTPLYLSGPRTLTKHTCKATDENGWSSDFCVYVFGEFHGKIGCDEWNEFLSIFAPNKSIKNENKIMGIHDFLREVAETSPVFLDIFIEMQRPSEKEERWLARMGRTYIYDYYLNKIRKIFKEKMTYIDNKTIEFNRMENVRVHAIDERRNHEGEFLWEFYNIHFKKEYLEIKDIARDFLKAIEENLTIDDPDKFIDKFYMSDKILEKEFNRLTNKNKNLIRTYIVDSWRERNTSVIEDAVRHFKNHMGRNDPLRKRDVFDLYDYFRKVQISFMSSHVDMYFLSRFLKGFKSKTEPLLPYNSIIYTGENHSNRYRKFLTKLGFEEQSLTIDDFLTKKDMGGIDVNLIDSISTLGINKNSNIVGRAYGCLHIDRKKMYPMFGVKNCDIHFAG